MAASADIIAEAVIAQFSKLPSKRKPKVRDNGLHEWVPISGIVAEKDGHFTCVSLATGMKCLPASKITQANGIGLHDWHAEVLAIRTFNRYIIDECISLMETGSSEFLENTNVSGSLPAYPFRLKPGIKLHMYASEAPCGDASMENLMAAQEDASPWDVPATAGDAPELPGRAYFSQLGVVRRKPARGDAPPTLSKSCSDKIALKQCTSLLAALPSLFVDPSQLYMDTLVLPEDQYSAVACERAFSATGRMNAISDHVIENGYGFHPFNIKTTTVQFEHSRRVVQSRSDKMAASNLAAAWSLSGIEESILGGVLQGYKPFLPKGASRMSRQEMWELCRQLASKLQHWPLITKQLAADSHHAVKQGPLLEARNKIKSRARGVALQGWIQNAGDDTFSI